MYYYSFEIYSFGGISPTVSKTKNGRYGNFSRSDSFVTPLKTRIGFKLDSIPVNISVSIRSPIITASLECKFNRSKAYRIISGFGFPGKYAFFPVATSITDTQAPPDGIIEPFSIGSETSEFVQIN